MVLRGSKEDEIHRNRCIALIGQLKCLGKEEPWGVLAQHYCNLTTITVGTVLFITDNLHLLPKDLRSLVCADNKKENYE